MRTFAAFAVFCAAASAAAQPVAVDSLIRGARGWIEGGRAAEAIDAIAAVDKTRLTPRDQARLWFYTARAHEELDDETSAEADYGRAVALEPTYGAAMNNLAQLLVRRGEAARAAALLKRAAALDDPRHLLYVDNYAAAAEKAGDVEGARNAYAEVAAAQQDNIAAQINSIRLLDDPWRIAAMLSKLASRGEPAAAQALALELLAGPFDARGKRALLGVVAGALARQRVAPRQFDKHPAAARLAALRADAAIAAGIDEMMMLVRGEASPASLAWWRSAHDEHFGALIRQIGVEWAAAGDAAKAEACYKLAVDYAGGSDADAFVELADLYFGQKRVADLDALVRAFPAAARDYAAEYRFRLALGTMYASFGRWSDAVTQLTEARRAAADYNRDLKWGAKIATDPRSIELLADGYAMTNGRDRAIALRIDSAAELAADGRKTAANQVLAPLKADPSAITDPAYRQRYDAVIETLKRPMVIEYTISFPASTDVKLTSTGEARLSDLPRAMLQALQNALGSYVTGESDDERDRAEYKLLQLGVTRLTSATMSRTSGDFEIAVGAKPVKCHYVVSMQQ